MTFSLISKPYFSLPIPAILCYNNEIYGHACPHARRNPEKGYFRDQS
jgi:hypothetical protein